MQFVHAVLLGYVFDFAGVCRNGASGESLAERRGFLCRGGIGGMSWVCSAECGHFCLPLARGSESRGLWSQSLVDGEIWALPAGYAFAKIPHVSSLGAVGR